MPIGGSSLSAGNLTGNGNNNNTTTTIGLNNNPQNNGKQPSGNCSTVSSDWIEHHHCQDHHHNHQDHPHQHESDGGYRTRSTILGLIEDVRQFTDELRQSGASSPSSPKKMARVKHPMEAMGKLVGFSQNKDKLSVICQLGGLHAITDSVRFDHQFHQSMHQDTEGHQDDDGQDRDSDGNSRPPSNYKNECVDFKYLAGMALMNLTCGASENKSLICSLKPVLQSLIAQMRSPSDKLRRVTAGIFGNLSHRVDQLSIEMLRDCGAVRQLVLSAIIQPRPDITLKNQLSALWNLTVNFAPNKVDFCQVDGSIEFLCRLLTETSTDGQADKDQKDIIENGGGILKNIATVIAGNDEYRKILRKHDMVQVFLRQLKSPSLKVVGNACLTLAILSSRCLDDQKLMVESGAVPMLKSLVNSKHKPIALGSAAVLKNLINAEIPGHSLTVCQPNCSMTNSCSMPSLQARKMRAMKSLEEDITDSLTAMRRFIDEDDTQSSPVTSPQLHNRRCPGQSQCCHPSSSANQSSVTISLNDPMSRSDSRDSIGSTHSEPAPCLGSCATCPSCGQINRTYPFQVNSLQRPQKRNKKPYVDDNYNNSQPTMKTMEPDDVAVEPDPEPTDYSQLFNEGQVDDMIAPRAPKTDVAAEDTVRIYQTEGTPLNFSLSSSLTDLREGGFILYDDHQQSTIVRKPSTATPHPSVTSPTNGAQKPAVFKKPLPPPKPARLMNLKSPEAKPNLQQEVRQSPGQLTESQSTASSGQAATIPKSVCFEDEVKQTPLMFSRCSSIQSLGSCDVKSTADDNGSVVSEFSRFPSGVVSPSELPDSPCQSEPATPREPNAPTTVKPMERKSLTSNNTGNNSCNNISCNDEKAKEQPEVIEEANRRQPKTSESGVFADASVSYAVEGTPGISAIQSLATSLSSLNFDDPFAPETKDNETNGEQRQQRISESIAEVEETTCEEETKKEATGTAESEVVSHVAKRITFSQSIPMNDHDDHLDTIRVFQTEDTPALSKAASTSDLSMISGISGIDDKKSAEDVTKNKPNSDDDDDDDEDNEDDEALLLECIKSGMPRSYHQPLNTSPISAKGGLVTPKSSPNLSPDHQTAGQKCDFTRPEELAGPERGVGQSASESSDDDDQQLLEQCISLGMPKVEKRNERTAPEPKKDLTSTKKETANRHQESASRSHQQHHHQHQHHHQPQYSVNLKRDNHYYPTQHHHHQSRSNTFPKKQQDMSRSMDVPRVVASKKKDIVRTQGDGQKKREPVFKSDETELRKSDANKETISKPETVKEPVAKSSIAKEQTMAKSLVTKEQVTKMLVAKEAHIKDHHQVAKEQAKDHHHHQQLKQSLMTDSLMTDSGLTFSDLDSVKPPSLMAEMVSSSEFADEKQPQQQHPQPAKRTSVNRMNTSGGSETLGSSGQLLANVRPPSLMDEISGAAGMMTESCASISSDIFDETPAAGTNDQIVAAAASSAADKIQTLIQRTEEQSEDKKPVEEEFCVGRREDFYQLDDGTLKFPRQPKLIESDESDEDDGLILEKRMSPVGSENYLLDELSVLSAECSDEDDSHLTYNILSSPSRPRIVKPVVRPVINPPDRGGGHHQISAILNRNRIDSNSSIERYSPTAPRSPYSRHKTINNQQQQGQVSMKGRATVVKETRTSALRASRSRSVDTSEVLRCLDAQSNGRSRRPSGRDKMDPRMDQSKPELSFGGSQVSNSSRERVFQVIDDGPFKLKPVNSFKPVGVAVSSMYSCDDNSSQQRLMMMTGHRPANRPLTGRMSQSNSAHNIIGSTVSLSSSSSSNGPPATCTSITKKLEVPSKIALLWKKGKSTADRMLASATSGHLTSSKQQRSDLSRSIAARRSFGRSPSAIAVGNKPTAISHHQQQQRQQSSSTSGGLVRSSTYEKLPLNDDEASMMSSSKKNSTGDGPKVKSKKSSTVDFFWRRDKVNSAQAQGQAKSKSKSKDNNNSGNSNSNDNSATTRTKSGSKDRDKDRDPRIRTCLVTAV